MESSLARRLLSLGLAASLGRAEECVVETQRCNFPFSSPGSGQLHYSCQATSEEGGPPYFCRSQVGEAGQERHTYGICNGGCYDTDGVTPMEFEEGDIFAGMCKTAASRCKFPFTWNGTQYRSCTTEGVGQYAWCALEVDLAGVLVADRWGACNMAVCPAAVEPAAADPREALAEFMGEVIGVVQLKQEASDNPVEVLGQLEGLPPGLFRLRLLPGGCGAGGQGGLLGEQLGSTGNSSTYVSSAEWRVGLFPGGGRLQVEGAGLAIVTECDAGQEACREEQVACAAVLSTARPPHTSLLVLGTGAAVAGILILLIGICLYCLCCRRRASHKISRAERGSVDDIYLGSRSKSPLYDELSIPFIDASLPPTPKGARSQNALEILLGRQSIDGSSDSLSEKAS